MNEDEYMIEWAQLEDEENRSLEQLTDEEAAILYSEYVREMIIDEEDESGETEQE